MAVRRRSSTDVFPEAQVRGGRAQGGSRREVLVVGELAPRLRGDLQSRGASLTTVETLGEAIMRLAEAPYDVVVLDLHTEGHGLDLVHAIKEGPVEHEHTLITLYGGRGGAVFLRGGRLPPREVLVAARERHRLTPFVILPPDESWTYAVVVVPPVSGRVQDSRKLPLVAAIMTVEPEAYLLGAKAMA